MTVTAFIVPVLVVSTVVRETTGREPFAGTRRSSSTAAGATVASSLSSRRRAATTTAMAMHKSTAMIAIDAARADEAGAVSSSKDGSGTGFGWVVGTRTAGASDVTDEDGVAELTVDAGAVPASVIDDSTVVGSVLVGGGRTPVVLGAGRVVGCGRMVGGAVTGTVVTVGSGSVGAGVVGVVTTVVGVVSTVVGVVSNVVVGSCAEDA